MRQIFRLNKSRLGMKIKRFLVSTTGYGLKCHRVIKSLCQLAGIKDLHVKIEGTGNLKKAVRAFTSALQEQVKYIAQDDC